MTRLKWLGVLTLALMAQGLSLVGNAQTRVEEYFKVFPSERAPDGGKPALFLRRDPITAIAIGFEHGQLARMATIVTIFAKASSLPLTFSDKGANLILIRAPDTHRGTKLNPEALRQSGIGLNVIATMNEDGVWGSGCGIYNFRNKYGSISASIGVVDAALSEDEQRVCSSFIIAAAFGFGLGLNDGTSLPREVNVYRNAYIVRVVSLCKDIYAQQSNEQYKKCIEGEVSKFLQLDIKALMHTNANSAGEDVIFARTAPIVLGYGGFDQTGIGVIEETVALYAEASSLPVSVSDKNVNLAILKAENISDGDALRTESLAKYSLSDEMIRELVQLPGWSRGCGVYAFRGKDGRVSTSVGIVDKSLSRQDERDCLNFIISMSFGVEVHSKELARDDAFTYAIAYLLSIVPICERENRDAKSALKCIGERYERLN
ncbi:hypothetical protein [Microvirga puerhi]|uniref:Uncharacterized protein n=1 Tax=Microvirga puerhi TaxID=2876078 RepID=A0ABS7VLT1_9HYPH|nr:hypothetical protein [Microvirga puerhi]MBZ6076502.1 hypothetical protein [Microvirga puerhi]